MHQAMQMVFNPIDAGMRDNVPRPEHGTCHGSPRNAVHKLTEQSTTIGSSRTGNGCVGNRIANDFLIIGPAQLRPSRFAPISSNSMFWPPLIVCLTYRGRTA